MENTYTGVITSVKEGFLLVNGSSTLPVIYYGIETEEGLFQGALRSNTSLGNTSIKPLALETRVRFELDSNLIGKDNNQEYKIIRDLYQIC